MKKLSAILIAIALVFGLSQCKKEKPATPNTEDGMVYITVNVGDNGGKHEVYPSTGAYVFENGDKLYVGNNGQYIGTLTYNNGAFSGGITSPSTSDYLHFYFLGGLTTTPTELTAGTTSYTVSIADQSSKLPILSYGQSTQRYTDANATYSTTLRNKCALAKFTLSAGTNATVSVGGMYTTATADFANPGTFTFADEGTIILQLGATNTERWAILLPHSAVDGAMVTVGSANYSVDVPAIEPNALVTGIPTIGNAMLGGTVGGWTNNSDDPWGGSGNGGNNNLGGWTNNGNGPW